MGLDAGTGKDGNECWGREETGQEKVQFAGEHLWRRRAYNIAHDFEQQPAGEEAISSTHAWTILFRHPVRYIYTWQTAVYSEPYASVGRPYDVSKTTMTSLP